jgi:hypothetical protein
MPLQSTLARFATLHHDRPGTKTSPSLTEAQDFTIDGASRVTAVEYRPTKPTRSPDPSQGRGTLRRPPERELLRNWWIHRVSAAIHCPTRELLFLTAFLLTGNDLPFQPPDDRLVRQQLLVIF